MSIVVKASTYDLTEEAYLTILLHAAKYPSCTVCGVLLGKVSSKACTATAAVPLFHLSMLLAPCVETALAQVEAYAQQQSLQLLGYYHCESRFDAREPHPAGKRIAERIADRQPEAFMICLDNPKLAAFSREGSNEPPFELLLREAGPKGSWKKVPAGSAAGSLGIAAGGGGSSGSSWEGLRARFLNAHARGMHHELADFDEHLDDISRDYLNAGLLGSGSQLLLK
ncbi:hypothetical protein OEZ85_011910 [Tetradesmus obliquus]|uniref:MPN domain-containing protein n=1 Tax=Tetradesmus obliquus TaxID=3088 RepID=A0ABY8TRW0_TETOB|nr:hypothetical protein OEZ85_011910 [Tetradesmus obliquus]